MVTSIFKGFYSNLPLWMLATFPPSARFGNLKAAWTTVLTKILPSVAAGSLPFTGPGAQRRMELE